MLGLIAVLSLLLGHTLGIATITAKGAKLFYSTGDEYYIKGVAYQLIESDSLINAPQCQRDAALMKELGANTIRVYHVEPQNDHSGCMSAFEAAGIYVWVDLDTTDSYILGNNGDDPSWTQSQYQKFQAVMDEFQAYDNTAGFFVANELIFYGNQTIAAPYIKAAARDMKAYRDSKGYRAIPVGFSAADVSSLRPNLQNYMACGDNPADALDFYSLNAYEWCGRSTYETSGYNMLEQNATGYSLPLFFSEDGCNVPEPRTFDDQDSILGPEMDDTWSGAIIYQWIQVSNNYGLVSMVRGSSVVGGYTRYGTPTPKQPDFNNLRSHWATLNPVGVNMDAYKPDVTPPPCPKYTRGVWELQGDVPLPTIGETGNYLSKQSRAASHSVELKSGPLTTNKQSKTTAAGDHPASTSSANSAARIGSRDMGSGGLEGLESLFSNWSSHRHMWFWVFGLALAVAGPAFVL